MGPLGLDEKCVTKFFQAQIDASKEIQKNDFTFWQQEGMLKFEEVFSLKNELHSYIDHLNHEMMVLLSKIYAKDLNVNTKFILDCPFQQEARIILKMMFSYWPFHH